MKRLLPLILVACADPTPVAMRTKAAEPAPLSAPHASIAKLAGTRWQGAAPKLNPETGESVFDFDDPDVAYEMVLNADGTGRTRWALWSLACQVGEEVCDMRWKAHGRMLTFSPSWDPSWRASWVAIIVDGNLQLSTTGALISKPTGTLKFYDNRMTLQIGQGSCTYQYPGHKTHTGPCEWVKRKGYRELRYEESSLDGSIHEKTMRWYANQGFITPPPAHVYRPLDPAR